MKKSDFNILVACEESGRVCSVFFDLGFNVFSCDIKPTTGNLPFRHIVCNVLDLLYPNVNVSFSTQTGNRHFISKWDCVIAFPPCTYFSRVNFLNYYRNGVFNSERFNKSLYFVDLFNKIFYSDVNHILIENPLPMNLFRDLLPPYSMRFQPFEFGEPFSKLTCLWLKNLPYLMPTIICSYHKSFVDLTETIKGSSIEERSTKRSKTFLGVAEAIGNQYCSYFDSVYHFEN